MTAAVLTRRRSTASGLRPIDARRDLAAVAGLIETTFAGRLDSNGRRMLREMRMAGKAGWLGSLVAWLFLPAMAPPQGFVWEEDGRVVGNASLLRVEGHRERWVLANVAVQAEFRRRGIARRLTQACLDLAWQRRVSKVLLQVDADNLGAAALYTSLGFRHLTTRTTWTHPPGKALLPEPAHGLARRRTADEWKEQWALASRLHPEGLVWPFPVQLEWFRPGPMSEPWGLRGRGQWIWPSSGPIAGSLTARWATDRPGWRLILVVDPAGRGLAEVALLREALAEAEAQRAALVLDYPPGPADAQLSQMGWRPERTLAWMSVDLWGAAGVDPHRGD